MEIFAILAMVLGKLFEGIFTSRTNSQNINNANAQLQNQQLYNSIEAEKANERAIENYNETLSPQAKLQQIKEAGLSPGLMYGGAGLGGGVSTSSQATAPNANLPIMQNPLAGGINDIFENLKKLKESENIGEDTEKKKSEIESIKSGIEVNNSTIEKIATENKLTEVLTSNAKLDSIYKQIENEIAESTKENRIETVATQLQNLKKEGEKLLEEINGLKIDNDNKQKMYDATISKIAAETRLIWKTCIKTDAETLMVKSQTALYTEQTQMTFAQRQKTYIEYKQLEKLTAKIEAETKLIEQETGLKKLEKVTEIIGWIETAGKLANNITGAILKTSIIPK